MVPGVAPSPDKMLQGRLFSYPDTHRYRIGTNYLQLPVNRPHAAVHSYNRDGSMRQVNPGDPVYAPNSAGGPAADPGLWTGENYGIAGEIIRAAYTLHAQDDDFGQPRTLWEKALTETEREHLIANIAAHAGTPEVTADMRKRVIEYWANVHADIGAGLSESINGG
jgi:catalase